MMAGGSWNFNFMRQYGVGVMNYGCQGGVSVGRPGWQIGAVGGCCDCVVW